MARCKVGCPPVYCTRCKQRKSPIGRSAPMEMRLCDWDCPGYYQDPTPCDLWSGETREEFGFPKEES